MSLLDGPLNVLGQRTSGESVRTQNGELLCCIYSVFQMCVISFSVLLKKMDKKPDSSTACNTRAAYANASAG